MQRDALSFDHFAQVMFSALKTHDLHRRRARGSLVIAYEDFCAAIAIARSKGSWQTPASFHDLQKIFDAGVLEFPADCSARIYAEEIWSAFENARGGQVRGRES